MVNRNCWTKEELVLLRAVYSQKTNEELVLLFPRHTKSSIQDEASSRQLGLMKTVETRRQALIKGKRDADRYWTQKEIKILKEHFPTSSMEKLLELLSRQNKIAIWHKGEELSLRRPTTGRFRKGCSRLKESTLKQAKTISGENNVSKRPEVKIKISETHKKNIKEGKYNPASWLNIKPTQCELKLIKILDNYKLPFKYVGNGLINIGSLNPDFISTDGSKKIIEVFGRVFHDPTRTFKEKIPWHQTYEGRIEYMRSQGYDCLIFWDDELEDPDTVLERVNAFLTAPLLSRTSRGK